MAVSLSDLRDEVLIIVRDSSDSTLQLIDVKLNEALQAVADTVVIPELKRVGVFTTVVGQAWTTMPTGFNGKLLFVGNDSTSLAIADSGVKQLMEKTPLLDESGPVNEVAMEGNIIYYQGIPSIATSYPILYVVRPDALQADADSVPDYFPPQLQRSLFVHYAAAMVYDTIEDGISGDKVNTIAQLRFHQNALAEFAEYVAKRRVASKRSVWLN